MSSRRARRAPARDAARREARVRALGCRAEIGPGKRIAAYAIVAPTERNFHSAGLFFAALIGASLGRAPLASLVEACVVFDVALQEPARA